MVLKLDATTFKAVTAIDMSTKTVQLSGAVGSVIADGSSIESVEFDLHIYNDGSLVESWFHIAYGGKIETAETAASNKGIRAPENMINGNSNYIEVVDEESATVWEDVVGEYPYPAAVSLTALSGGLDGTAPSSLTAADFGTDYLPYLNNADNATLIIAPDAYVLSDADVVTVNNSINSYCENRKDCFGILGFAEDVDTSAEAVIEAGKMSGISYAALYYPWVTIPDGLTGGKINVPPVGNVAGVVARIDAKRGVHKAPAGNEAVVKGIIEPIVAVDNGANEVLLPAKVNPIRFYTGVGNVIWGTRTLAQDAAWRYIPIRRLMIYIEESIWKGIGWSIFEPNDTTLWAKLRLNITSFLMNVYRTGALAGTKPSEAFYVRCDASNNPQSEIDAGRVNVELGIAPVKPAEFVIVKVGLWDGGSTISEV